MLKGLLHGADMALAEALVDLLEGENRRVVRISKEGDIIALTEKARAALDEEPGDCFFERLTDVTEQIIREVIEQKKTRGFSENFGEEVMFDVTAVPTEEGAALLMEPKSEQDMLDIRMQIDMRGSLQAILSALHLDAGADPQTVETIENRVYELQRMLTHAELLRSAERWTHVRFREDADLAALCRMCAEQFMEAGGPKVTVSAPRKVLAVCDPSLLLRAILNLLTNARKAQHISITLTHRGRGKKQSCGNYLIAVEDDGAGLPPEELEWLNHGWRRTADLSQVKPGDSFGLPGTGLPVAAQIAEGHRGRLLFEQREGGGSRFCISFPDDLEVESLGVASWPEEEDTSVLRSELAVVRQCAGEMSAEF